jgi:hypothetical protein
VVALLADADRRRRLSQAARDRCRERFEIRAVAPRYLALYEQLVAA